MGDHGRGGGGGGVASQILEAIVSIHLHKHNNGIGLLAVIALLGLAATVAWFGFKTLAEAANTTGTNYTNRVSRAEAFIHGGGRTAVDGITAQMEIIAEEDGVPYEAGRVLWVVEYAETLAGPWNYLTLFWGTARESGEHLRELARWESQTGREQGYFRSNHE
jgi:hypothetical protein